MKTKKQIEAEEFKVTFTNGTGAGGQKRNRTLSVATVTHLPTNISQRCDDSRSASKNMNIAYDRLVVLLQNDKMVKYQEALNRYRVKAMANGTIRTYNFQRNEVKNHLTGQTAPLDKVLNGKIELINHPIKKNEKNK